MTETGREATQHLGPLDDDLIEERVRRDLGDVGRLAGSMASLGQLQPILIRQDGRLIAGERRVAAMEIQAAQELLDGSSPVYEEVRNA